MAVKRRANGLKRLQKIQNKLDRTAKDIGEPTMPISRKRKPKNKPKKRNTPSAGDSTKSVLLDRVKGSQGISTENMLIDDERLEKMSTVILHFAEPLTDVIEAGNRSAYQSAIALAILAWNASLLPEKERGTLLEETFLKLAKDDARELAELYGIMDMMIERKNKFFADNKRFIIDYQMGKSGRQGELYVASTVHPPE